MKKFFMIGCSSIFGLFVFLFVLGLIATITDSSSEEGTEQVIEGEQGNAKSNEQVNSEGLEKQKEHYLTNIKPEIEKAMKIYDQAWEDGWVPTFEAISTGNANIYTAYDNLKIIKNVYRDLSVSVDKIPVDGLSKEHQETLKSALRDFSYASTSRQMASEKAMKMIDNNDYSPSTVEKIKNDISSSQSRMISAIASITSVELELGVIQEDEQATN